MIVLGLTGSIGVGKTTIASFLLQEGVAVCNTDLLVHELYRQKAIIAQIRNLFPEVIENGIVNRKKLAKIAFYSQKNLKKLEEMIHPYVRKAELFFLKRAYEEGCKIALIDIPLLYETHAESLFDYILVASVPSHVQKKRVLSRFGMTEDMFSMILSYQDSNEEKCNKADFIINTDTERNTLQKNVRSLIAKICIMRRG
ncbi:MAG: dephospho-CoA kinase [Candidatus Tokpelaia sp. JSC161]|nr:MAG: dephospho-CoA kinase [Candidatus Tokpelaia sp. JSC161]